MRSTEQIRLELLAALSQLSQVRPEWRLGQTLANLAMTAGRLDPGGVWDLEDEEALVAATTLIEQYSEVESEAAELVAARDRGGPASSARHDGVAGDPSR
jgi:hypothetical protein